MTLKDFSRKYDIPYGVVYAASYKVQPVCGDVYEREYPEKELRAALYESVCSKINYYQDKTIRNITYKHKLEENFP